MSKRTKYRPSQFNYITRSYKNLCFALAPYVDITSYTLVGTNVNSGMKMEYVDYRGCEKDGFLWINWDWGIIAHEAWEFVCTFITADGDSIVEHFFLYPMDTPTTGTGLTANPITVKGTKLEVTFNSQMATFSTPVKSVTCMYSISEADNTYGDSWTKVVRPSTSTSVYSFTKTLENLKPNTNYRIDCCQQYIIGDTSSVCYAPVVTYFFRTSTDNLTISYNEGGKIKSTTIFYNKNGEIKEVCEGYVNQNGVVKQMESS